MPAATGGGDYGPGWLEEEEEADDTAGPESPKFDVGVLPDSDPTGWEYDSTSGIYYRSPTDDEMTDYGWTADVLLVVPESTFVSDVVASEATARIRIPIHDFSQSRPQEDLTIADIALTKQWATSEIPYRLIVEPRTGPATRTTLRPTLSYYLPTGIDIDDVPERTLAVVSSSRGGMSVFGGAPYEQVHMRGPHTDGAWYDLELGPPGDDPFFILSTFHGDESGSALARDPVGALSGFVAQQALQRRAGDLTAQPRPATDVTVADQCDDDLDNDPDCAADAEDYNCMEHTDFGGHIYDSTVLWEQSKDFALFGDMSFCSSCDGVGDDCSPETELMEYAIIATGILNSVEVIAAYEPATKVPPFRMTMYGCLAIYDETEQDDCDFTTSCELAGYPLLDTDDSYSQKVTKAWSLVDWVVGGMAAADRHPVHIAGIVTDIVDGTSAEPGLALSYDPDEPGSNGSLVVRARNDAVPTGAGRTLAHEIGHTLGLDDDDEGQSLDCEGQAMGATNEYTCTMKWPNDGNFYPGFMRQGNGFSPTLDWDDGSAVPGKTQGAVWRDFGPSKFHPRASGFGWTDCTDQNHPGCGTGLTCNTSVGVCEYE